MCWLVKCQRIKVNLSAHVFVDCFSQWLTLTDRTSNFTEDFVYAQKGWVESEKLTPKPDPAPTTKTPDPNPVRFQILDSGSGSVPISAMLLHTFYIYHTIHTGSGFSQ